ncbi:hypothetical protein VIGAN_08234100 [Vigna angularis var. angularis]|uniref:Uncharacterized protein n=1 Tax=Vigna angularis var. angularis TaxID=157739 RepID=A0A0S3SRX8_PHAAN|nr:hypothetical protein VIGAN_08234100 [Vigna angularis var. angularis]
MYDKVFQCLYILFFTFVHIINAKRLDRNHYTQEKDVERYEEHSGNVSLEDFFSDTSYKLCFDKGYDMALYPCKVYLSLTSHLKGF